MKTTDKIYNQADFETANVFGTGNPNTAFAAYFTGNSYLNPLTEMGKAPVFLANVSFEPGCRNNWHIHRAAEGGGQILICTAGEGWYQEEGKAPVSLRPGMVVVIPPTSVTGTAQKRIPGSAHCLELQAGNLAMNGVSR